MALSLLLRGALKVTKVSPALGVSARYCFFASLRTPTLFSSMTDEKRAHNVPNAPKLLSGLSRLQQLTTSSVVQKSQGGGHHMDHGRLWSYEKLVTISLLGVMPLHVMYPNVLFDVVMSVLLVMHAHWGLEAVVIDYVRPIIFGNTIPKVAIWMLYAFSTLFLIGLFNLIFNSSGLGNSVRMFWSL